MDIYVLNSQYKRIGVIDYCSSIIWTKRYCNAGDFELYLPLSQEAIEMLTIGNMLMRGDGDKSLMIISSIKITTDEESGDSIIVSGQSAESIISKRIVWKQTNLSGSLTGVVKQLLNENLISPIDTNRKINNFIIGTSCGCSITIEKQITGDNLIDAIIGILSPYKLGFEVIYDNQLKFNIYSGKNRSLNQTTNPKVIFSNEYDNLLSSEYIADASEFKNIALVAGEGEGVNRRTLSVGSASGMNRNEIFVDARDISSEVDGGTLTPAQYNELLNAKGVESLGEKAITKSFEGTIEPSINYEFGVDYNLGDVVQITNEYGMTSPARITEVIESWDENGYSCIPTFNSEEV